MPLFDTIVYNTDEPFDSPVIVGTFLNDIYNSLTPVSGISGLKASIDLKFPPAADLFVLVSKCSK